MTNHECEWKILLVQPDSDTVKLVIKCADYDDECVVERLSKEEAEAMLNEHPKLKRELFGIVNMEDEDEREYRIRELRTSDLLCDDALAEVSDD